MWKVDQIGFCCDRYLLSPSNFVIINGASFSRSRGVPSRCKKHIVVFPINTILIDSMCIIATVA